MKTNQVILTLIAITVLACIAFLVFSLFPEQKPEKPVDRVLTEDIGNAREKSDLIRLSSPRPGEVVTSPLTIRGEARGYWFFEASFPVEFVDEKWRVLTGTIATAQSDWMTEEFVPFEAVLEFESDTAQGSKGILVLKRDNPSGLPENDDALKVPVIFGSADSEKSILKNPSYEDIIRFIDENITDIIGEFSPKKATNGAWFADGFGFTSASHAYVDFEDGHFLFRALLQCDSLKDTIVCTPLAILEKQEREWVVIKWTDTQKGSPVIHTWAKDYEWQR